jgi:glycosyltransferase involved in cell wall biosynthesis
VATSVLELELRRLPASIEVADRYHRASVLVRSRGRPLVTLNVPVRAGRVDMAQLRRGLVRALRGAPAWIWLGEVLGIDASATEGAAGLTASVAICTRDRPDDLRRALDAVTSLPDRPEEILVIDNASISDETRRVAAAYPAVRYVREDRPGLNVARNRALAESRYDIVAFTDDDAVPEAGWLASLKRPFTDPMVLCATGLTLPLELETEAQEAFERHNSFARGCWRCVLDGTRHDPLRVARAGAGVNMAVRRSIASLIGGFDEALDAGTPTCSGGDHEMFSRILIAGYRIVYEPAAISRHRHRRSWDELRRTLYGYGVGVYAMWTRRLLVDHEWGVIRRAAGWFWRTQLRTLARSLMGRPGAVPLDLVWAELRGCATGPFAYLQSRSRSRRRAAAPNVVQAFRPAGGTATDNPPHDFVSIIIPTHNRPDHLRRALDALARQTYPRDWFEVIVAPDGRDNALEALSAAPWPFALRIAPQPGPIATGAGAARNRGAALARGTLLIFLDDDIEADPGLVRAHVSAQTRVQNGVAIGYLPPALDGRLDFFGVMLRGWWEAIFQRMRDPGHRFTYQDLLSGNCSMPAAVFNSIGRFHASLRCHEDYELGYRLIRAGAAFTFAGDARGVHHEATDLPRALRRKYDEGRADVVMGRLHPALRTSLPWSSSGTVSARRRILQKLALRWPRAGDAAAHASRATLPLLEIAAMRSRWRKRLDDLLWYWYWRGVGAELETTVAEFRLDEVASGRAAGTGVEIDLRDGLAPAEQQLDACRPDTLSIRYGSHAVGRVALRPGAEPLAGRHLRAILASDVCAGLAEVLKLEAIATYSAADHPFADVLNGESDVESHAAAS